MTMIVSRLANALKAAATQAGTDRDASFTALAQAIDAKLRTAAA